MNTTSTPRPKLALEKYRVALQARLAEYASWAHDRTELAIEPSADDLDRIRMATDRDLAVLRLNQTSQIINQARLALDALDHGEYGICEECDEAISARRLEAVPWTRVCIRCQEVRDETARQVDTEFERAA